MADSPQPNKKLLEEILSLETRVWQALVAGDPVADGRMLTTDFLGVYPSGFATKAEHCAQLSDGSVMKSFALSQAKLRVISPIAVLLSYCADYQRTGSANKDVMYITSLWERGAGGWLNSFSQDTPAA